MARYSRARHAARTTGRSDSADADSSSSPEDITALSTVNYRDADHDSGEVPLVQIDNFFVPGRDDKGASQPITLHVPPFFARCLDVMIHSKRFPYANREDLLRHAGLRHLRWLSGIRTTVAPQMIPELDAILEVHRDAEFRMRMEKAFRDLDRLVEIYVRSNEQGEAVRIINLIMTRMHKVESSARHREFIANCLRRYSQVMAGVPGWEEGLDEMMGRTGVEAQA
jgi:hypothetical protein